MNEMFGKWGWKIIALLVSYILGFFYHGRRIIFYIYVCFSFSCIYVCVRSEFINSYLGNFRRLQSERIYVEIIIFFDIIFNMKKKSESQSRISIFHIELL